jgi:hypothetical protein
MFDPNDLELDDDGVRIVRAHGKFEGELYVTALAWEASMEGGFDEEAGNSTEGPGFAGLFAFDPSPKAVAQAVAFAKRLDDVARETDSPPLTEGEHAFIATKAGVLMLEQTDGFVLGTWEDTAKKLQRRWDAIVDDLEGDGDEEAEDGDEDEDAETDDAVPV